MQLGILCWSSPAHALCRRLARQGMPFALYLPDPGTAADLAPFCLPSPQAVLAALPGQRIVWLIEPAPSDPVRFDWLLTTLSCGDTLVDAGRSGFAEALARCDAARRAGVSYLDVGVTLSDWGTHYGFALMIGGSADRLAPVAPQLNALAPVPDGGWLHCGPAGSGAFMRQLQYETEAALLQGMTQAHQAFDPQQSPPPAQEQLNQVWQQGSALRQRLSTLAASYLAQVDADQAFTPFFPLPAFDPSPLPHIPHPSWPALELARIIQFASSSSEQFEQQILALLRTHPNGFQFGSP